MCLRLLEVQLHHAWVTLHAAGEVAKLALARGYINVMGKTPEATMASAMYTDVKRKGHEGTSIFIRPHEGLFGLRQWVDQGIAYEVRGCLLGPAL